MTAPITHCPECNEPLVNVCHGSPYAVCPNGHARLYPRLKVDGVKRAAHKAKLAQFSRAERIEGVKATDALPYNTHALWTIPGEAGIWREDTDGKVKAIATGNRIRRFSLWPDCPVMVKEDNKQELREIAECPPDAPLGYWIKVLLEAFHRECAREPKP
jgi:hypothetical protein